MSDVEKDTEATTEESDFEGHKKRKFDAHDESGSEENEGLTDDSEDFEGHKHRKHD